MSTNYKKNQKIQLLGKTNGICAHCGCVLTKENYSRDHFIPRRKGGKTYIENLMPLCKDCNQLKADSAVNPRKFYIFANEASLKDCCRYRESYKHLDLDEFLTFLPLKEREVEKKRMLYWMRGTY